jgi:CDP-diglyceride synthetase
VTSGFVHLLLLIIVANGAPVLLRFFMRGRLDVPLDAGAMLPDGRRLFGDSKTWRGVVGALLATPAAAALLDYGAGIGVLVAVFAILGDLISSFSKRRLGMRQSCMAPLLDQVPESLLPALVLMRDFGLDDMHVIALVAVFVVVELLLSLLLYRLGVRNRPY